MSAYDNDPRVENLSDDDFILYVVNDGNGNHGRVELSGIIHWAAMWVGEKPRYYASADDAIRSLIGNPQ